MFLLDLVVYLTKSLTFCESSENSGLKSLRSGLDISACVAVIVNSLRVCSNPEVITFWVDLTSMRDGADIDRSKLLPMI